MKYALIAVAIAAFAAPAVAAGKMTDVDYLRANRCKGLATSIEGVVDPAALTSVIKAERGARATYIVDRGEEEFNRARKEAKSQDRKERLTAELTGACQAYLGGATSVAKQGKDVANP
ncbi:hypothetical protein [Phenylobacterium sp.]|uniref:hypothetical protein n=1 Tax=Phenylobacterium sp. TaxID=1871053 RepID=UPI003BA9201B